MPGGTQIFGPVIVPIGNDSLCVLNIGPEIISDEFEGLQLVVTVTNEWNHFQEYTQYYLVDGVAPQIDIISPVAMTEFEKNDIVTIDVMIEDLQNSTRDSEMNKVRDNRSVRELGSGVNLLKIQITDSESIVWEKQDYLNMNHAISHIVIDEFFSDYGLYTIIVTTEDNVGNESTLTRDFIVTASVPAITFTPNDTTGWWLNPAVANQLCFELSGIEGIGLDAVTAEIYSVPGGVKVLGPVIVPFDNNNHCVLDIGPEIISDGFEGLQLLITVTNEWNHSNEYSQYYMIDGISPQYEFVTPDEDQIFINGEAVEVEVNFSDLQEITLNTRNSMKQMYSSRNSGSGVQSAVLKVSNTENTFEDSITTSTESTLKMIFNANNSGSYTAELTVIDLVGNVSIATREFLVVQESIISIGALGEKGIVFYKPNVETEFTAKITGQNLDENDISLKFEHLYEDGSFGEYLNEVDDFTLVNDTLSYSFTPIDLNNNSGLRMTITIMSDEGYIVTESMIFYKDETPVTITVPILEEEYLLGDVLNINISLKDENGSGLDRAEMILNNVAEDVTIENDMINYSITFNNEAVLEYNLELKVYDNAGNVSTKIWNFTVNADAGKTLSFDSSIKPFFYPNPVDRGNTGKLVVSLNKEANVEIRIFDFAGKTVKKISDRFKTKEIDWDGKTDSGTQLARGSYFAKIVVRDNGRKIEKIVKIAVK